MSRIIRNPRAQALQGQRAGIASRALAFAVDLGIAFAIFVAILVGANVLWDVFFSDTIEVPAPSGWLSAPGLFVTLVVYLTLGWGSTGRSIGKQIMGLRVVRADTRSLKPGHAFVRALFCAAFYPGLLLALFDRRNRSLQDVICRTVVVYDWIPEAAKPRRLPTSAPAAPPTGRSGFAAS